MKLNDKKIKLLFIPVILLLTIGAIVFYANFFHNLSLAYFTCEDFGDMYIKKWKSTDGKVTFITDNKQELLGIPVICDGYYDNGDERIEITFYTNISKATISDLCLFQGDSDFNFFTNAYIVTVTKSDPSISPYRKGDKIVFFKEE